MVIDLSEIIKDFGGKIDISGSVDLGNAEFMGDTFIFERPVLIRGTIANNTKSLDLEAKAEGEMKVHCARCQKPFVVPVKFRIHEILVSGEDNTDDSDVIAISGDELDIDEIVLNNFYMSLPGRFLCSEDCKGLCPKCGADLNLGGCGCDKEDIDPRWADLQKIMKDMADTE